MENSVIYGLEFQARALTPQLGETEVIRFLVGTQSLKQTTNHIHLVEFNDEDSTIKTRVFQHPAGEIWRITTNPTNSSQLATCYNSVLNENTCKLETAIYSIPEVDNLDEVETIPVTTKLDVAAVVKDDVKTTEFHPTDTSKTITVTNSNIILWDIGESGSRSVLTVPLEGKNDPKFTIGKWNPHQNCNQFTAATDTHLKTYDIRTGELAWNIDGTHGQLVRDLDYNMNKQYHLATCGDDAFVKIWDYRQTSQPIFCRSDHSHWVWSVRFNHFHDQLILTASSDARVLLSSAASVSSENTEDICAIKGDGDGTETKQMLSDGPLQWCEHEDSVYCAEWSPAEPWIFASLSYDGRLLISRVKKSLKYQIML